MGSQNTLKNNLIITLLEYYKDVSKLNAKKF